MFPGGRSGRAFPSYWSGWSFPGDRSERASPGGRSERTRGESPFPWEGGGSGKKVSPHRPSAPESVGGGVATATSSKGGAGCDTSTTASKGSVSAGGNKAGAQAASGVSTKVTVSGAVSKGKRLAGSNGAVSGAYGKLSSAKVKSSGVTGSIASIAVSTDVMMSGAAEIKKSGDPEGSQGFSIPEYMLDASLPDDGEDFLSATSDVDIPPPGNDNVMTAKAGRTNARTNVKTGEVGVVGVVGVGGGEGIVGGSGPIAPPAVATPVARSYASVAAGGGVSSPSSGTGEGPLQQRLLEALKRGDTTMQVEGAGGRPVFLGGKTWSWCLPTAR